MSNVHILYVGNTNKLELDDLTNEVTGEPINDATVTLTLKDTTGSPVSGETWPLPMPYVAGSAGLYRCYLASTLPLVGEAKYIAEVTANAGAALVGKWLLDVVAKTRR
jgi:hypothetical protein